MTEEKSIHTIDVKRLIAEGGGEDLLIDMDLQLQRSGGADLLLQGGFVIILCNCLLYTSPSPRD